MMNGKPYTYVLLRYRHDPRAGEFVNVGVVLHQPSARFLDVHVRKTLGPRITKMFPTLDGAAFKSGLSAVRRGILRLSAGEGDDMLATLANAESFARKSLPCDDSSFVWAPMGSGITNDPAKTLARLYDRFVAQYDEQPRTARDDAAIWRPVRERLQELKIADKLAPKTITSAIDEVEFEHAWKNGAWHCYQPLSFDLASDTSIKDKAARWAGHILALSGSKEAFKAHFLVGAPSQNHLLPAYRNAMKVLQLGGGSTEVIEEAAIDGLVHKIEDEIRAHEAAV
jgi:hypothetical protein